MAVSTSSRRAHFYTTFRTQLLYVTGVGSPNVLLRNQADGTFEDVAAEVGVTMGGSGIYRTSASFADIDADGDLNLFVGNLTGQDRLYRNDGADGFADVTQQAGLDASGHTTHHMFGDIDGDGRPDLAVCTRDEQIPDDAPRLSLPLRLYRNGGDGTFENVTERAGLELPLLPLEGCLFFDADNDGHLDLLATGFSLDQPNLYFRNRGDGTFEEAAADVGLDDPSAFSLGAVAGDFDSDGWTDVYVATAGANRLFRNRRDGTFERVPVRSGSPRDGHSFIPSVGSRDGQGPPDLAVTNGWSGQEGKDGTEFYENESVDGRWLRLDLTGSSGNRDALGARVDVFAADLRFSRWVHDGTGYGGDAPDLHLGLGHRDQIDSMIVRWPSGAVWDTTAVEADQALRIVEGGQEAAPSPAPAPESDGFVGTWRTSDGSEVVVGRTDRGLVWYEPATGQVRLLDPAGALDYRAGPGLLRDEPASFRVRRASASSRREQRLVVEGSGTRRTLAPAGGYTIRDVSFRGSGVRLAGRLFLPSGRGPHPGMVVVHGSGAQDRFGSLGYYELVAHRFADAGFAVLTFDKRGVGASSGEWRSASFDELASDVDAAASYLASRPRVFEGAVGLWGISQAGWVAARAVEHRPETAFAILVSAAGTALTPAEQNTFNVRSELQAAEIAPGHVADAVSAWDQLYELAGRDGGPSSRLDSLVRRLRDRDLPASLLPPRPREVDWTAGDQWFLALDLGFDPRPAWEHFDGQVLAVFGARDTSTPTDVVLQRIAELSPETRGRWSLTSHPGADHFLLESPSGSVRDLADRTRFAPDALEGMVRWAVETVHAARSRKAVGGSPNGRSEPTTRGEESVPIDLHDVSDTWGLTNIGDEAILPLRLDLEPGRELAVGSWFEARGDALRLFRRVEASTITGDTSRGGGAPDRDERRRNGIRFERLPEAAPRLGVADGGSVADVDGDGRDDAFVTGATEENTFLRNAGGRLVATDETGLTFEQDSAFWSSASFVDFDRDGRVDLFVGNVYGRDRLFRGDGSGRFSDVIVPAGLEAPRATGHHAFGDIDGDGDVDLFLTNNHLLNSRFRDVGPALYRNDGDGTFTDVTRRSGIDLGDAAPEGALFLDHDSDGDLDLFVTTFDHASSNRLFENRGDGIFTDVTGPAGIGGSRRVSVGVTAGDLDSDGWPEVIVANFGQPNDLWHNRGDGTFQRVVPSCGFEARDTTVIASVDDLDRDGDLDVLFTNRGNPDVACSNETGSETGPRKLTVELVGRDGTPLGASVELRTDAGIQTREVSGGNGYGGGGTTLHFGLEATGRIRELRVLWPSGLETSLMDLHLRDVVTLREPGRP